MRSGLFFAPCPYSDLQIGEVTERLKVHAWKACVRLKPYRGFESRLLRHFSLRTNPRKYKKTIVIVILLLLFALYHLGYKGKHSLDYEHPAFRSNPRFFCRIICFTF